MRNAMLHRTSRFTLIELLVVVAIMVVLLGISAGSWTRIVLGSSVDRAGRMVSAQLSLVRAEAVAKRRSVALVMPGANCFDTKQFKRPYNYSAMRAAYVTYDSGSDYIFDGWVPGTSWIYLPEGAIIAQCDTSIAELDLPAGESGYVPIGTCVVNDDGAQIKPSSSNKVDYKDEGDLYDEDGSGYSKGDPKQKFMTTGSLRVVVFNKDGSCAQTTYITIMEGIVPQGSDTPINTQPNNLNVMENKALTGKVRFLFH